MMTLQPLTRDNWQEALELGIAPEQLRFVAAYEPVALVGLAKAYVRPGGRLWLPFAFHDGAKMVGFVALSYHPDDPAEAWINHFFIDQRYQGQGLGALALQSLQATVDEHFPEIRRLNLTVHPENTRAQHLYRAAGFQPTGAESDGEPVYTLDMS